MSKPSATRGFVHAHIVRIALLVMAVALAACSGAPQRESLEGAADVLPASAAVAAPDAWPDPGAFEIADPFACPLALRCTLAQVRDAAHACALLVVRAGRLVYEYYESRNTHCTLVDGGKPNGPDKAFGLASIAKSMTASLFGHIHADPGRFGPVRLDDPVSRHVAGWPADSHLHAVTLRHALTMTSALRYDESNHDLERLTSDKPASDPSARTFLEVASRFTEKHRRREAGETFYYAALDTTLVGLTVEAVLARTAGAPQHLDDALSQWIWGPAGARGTARWKADKHGMPNPFCCFYATARDLARVGQYLLVNWQGPSSVDLPLHGWMRLAGRAHTTAWGETCRIRGRDVHIGYGFQWWALDDGNGFMGLGTGGQVLHIFPDQDTVIVQFGSWGNQWNDRTACAVHAAHRMLADRAWP